jgi:pimeloyl-ACP methyl ester carboxylesterase
VYSIDTIDDPGRSVLRRAVRDSTDNAAWIDQTLAGLGLDGVHLVGLSWGWLALNQAVYRPGRLASVTALDPGGIETVPATFLVHMLLGVLLLATPAGLRPWPARRLALQALLMPAEQLRPVLLAARTWRGTRGLARRFDDDELGGIGVPVQILFAGRSSLLRPEWALARVRALIPDVRAEIVEGAGHGLPLERPECVNRRILDFVATA